MNFCFVIDNLLSASSHPGKNRRMHQYINLYNENKIKVLYSVQKKIQLEPEQADNFILYHHKLEVLEVPPMDEVNKIVDEILYHIKKEQPVNVSCETGIGRSSLICMAVVMKYYGIGVNEAYKLINQHRYVNMEDGVREL
ncbi:MAG TPA: dual specificity protein phosphatase family protein, partial [Spirochaetota bacterium]|nr:dual specificity protein phosphatase family protein [Spirochaetota bacterium]